MVADAGGDPTAVAASITAEQETPTAGVTDAILILAQPGEPNIELGDEWLIYATGTIPPNQYVEALTFLFFLGVGVAPTAAARMNQ